MLILSRVCADFRNREGRVIFRIGPADRLTFLEAPEEIRGDPLFDMLLSEGSLEAVQSVSQKKQLEADPVQDTDATGKRKSTPKNVKADKSASVPASGETAGGAEPEAAPAADAALETGAKTVK